VSCDCCAIKNLIYQYASHLDDGDLDAVAALFRRGRILARDEAGATVPIEGAEAVLALYRAFTRIYDDDQTPHTLHMTTNVAVVPEPGSQRASATSYAVVFQSLADLPLQPIIGVRYYDRFVKDDDGWRFEERRIETRLTGDLSRHLLRDPGGQG